MHMADFKLFRFASQVWSRAAGSNILDKIWNGPVVNLEANVHWVLSTDGTFHPCPSAAVEVADYSDLLGFKSKSILNS